MFFKGIRQSVEQGVSLSAVVRLLLTEVCESASAAKPIQPASSPGAVIEDSMQVSA